MLIGRNDEINQLSTYYEREKSQIIVLYGQKYVGKTKLISEFMLDKPGYYYHADSSSEKEQHYKMGKWLASLGVKALKFPSFTEVFESLSSNHSQKKVIVIDEFHNIIKNCPTFMNEIISFIHNEWNNQEYLFVLVSSSVGFIENTLVSKIGEAAYELSGFLKVKELKFKDLREYFSLYTNEECLITWSILGGLPGLWTMFDEKQSLKENIIKKILYKSGPLHNVAKDIVNEELRETNVYNTILASIAEGKKKLNDLYEHTDFSRAKISVYIKNLMELELVEKVFSYDTEGRLNSQKGIYDISNKIVYFYYYFMYNNSSFIEFETPEEFYAIRLLPKLKAYVSKFYKDICVEHLLTLNDKNRLPIRVEKYGTWVGKQGNIDFVMEDEDGHNIIGISVYDKPMLTYDDYEWLLYTAEKAKIKPDYIYLYAGNRFDEKISIEAKIKDNITLYLLDRI